MKNEMVKGDDKALAKEEKSTAVYRPKIDIVENGTCLTIWADMPGVDDKGVDIQLDGQELTIKGYFNSDVMEKYTTCHHEYRSGNYERKFTLGNSIDQGGIKASLKDGVLKLCLPKAKEAQPKRIKVSTD
jgi:HSP20 family molecular chaperone IbpA